MHAISTTKRQKISIQIPLEIKNNISRIGAMNEPLKESEPPSTANSLCITPNGINNITKYIGNLKAEGGKSNKILTNKMAKDESHLLLFVVAEDTDKYRIQFAFGIDNKPFFNLTSQIFNSLIEMEKNQHSIQYIPGNFDAKTYKINIQKLPMVFW